ncbi:LWR-salt protein [Salinilacihabitans rarus]|uniref:LWR-salt protein n=1 Tax=Salinilacihabitans rarus TaxID=2961596 RepID=UPI0020C8603B|nr:LWR-salt protein [Salinilacihabitans rarus]
MDARYAFRVRLRIEPAAADVSLEPATFETRCYLDAAEPGEEGWLFFRDFLWRGEVNDRAYAREVFAERIGVPVESVEFAGLHADEAYVAALKEAIAADLEAFKADDVTEVLSKYLGSSVQMER